MMTYRMDIVTMYGTRLVSTFDHLDGAIACLRQQAQRESTVSARLVACEKQNGTLRLGDDDAGNPLEAIADKSKFHRLDALRYVGAYLVDGMEPESAWIAPVSRMDGMR